MYSSDSAIKTKNEDLLGRATFASELAKAILKNSGTDSIVVGLYGAWGCGKTSLVNMIIEEIENITRNDKEKPLIVSFAPWYFSIEENLVSAYFKTLRLSLNIEKNNVWKQRIGNVLDNYADALDVLCFVPGAGPILAPALKTVSKNGGKKLASVKSIDEAKYAIERVLLERDQKIIVVIDDIDRLENSQIRAVFQLVKQIASFPNTTYLLPMERNVVARALQEVQGNDGNEYLEKIVQIPIVIPELSVTKMQKIFFEKMNTVLSDNNITSIDDKYWSNIFSNCVWPFIYSLRDINRVANTLEFKMGFLKGEICIEDFIGMTTIDVLDPALYAWIGENRSILCGNVSKIYSLRSINGKEKRQMYENSLAEAGVKDVNRAIIAISALFPHFASEIEQHIFFNPSEDTAKRMRIADEKRAELFFELSKDNVAIPRDVVMNSITKYPFEEYVELLDEINSSGNIVYYLDELNALIDEIPYERYPLIIKAIWIRRLKFKGSNAATFIIVSTSWKAEAMVDKMLGRLKSDKERYDIMRELLINATIMDLESIGSAINKIELAYGRLAGTCERKQDQIIELSQLEDLEQEYAKRAYYLAYNTDIFESDSLIFFSYLWEAFGEGKYKVFLDENLTNSRFVLKYITRLGGKWYGSSSDGTSLEGWSFNSEYYAKYISNEIIYNIIESYDKKQMIQDFDSEELVKIASYYLNYGKSNMNDKASIKEAESLVNLWNENRRKTTVKKL